MDFAWTKDRNGDLTQDQELVLGEKQEKKNIALTHLS